MNGRRPNTIISAGNAKAVILLSLLLVSISAIASAEDTEYALKFYFDKLDSVLAENILYDSTLSFETEVVSRYHYLNYRGVLDKADTARYALFYRKGRIDSVAVIDSAGIDRNTVPQTLRFDKPWQENCRFYFFPNDSGSGIISIGFESVDASDLDSPSGVISFDRDKYFIQTLRLHYPSHGEYERFSLNYIFGFEQDKNVLKTLTIQGSFAGLFLKRYFRQDLYFENYQIRRK